jgi:hypothetical protein
MRMNLFSCSGVLVPAGIFYGSLGIPAARIPTPVFTCPGRVADVRVTFSASPQ